MPRSEKIPNVSRCCTIMFCALKCGKLNEDIDVLNFTYKLAPNGAGYDYWFEGQPSLDSCRVRAKKRVFDELRSQSTKRMKALEDIKADVLELLQIPSTQENGKDASFVRGESEKDELFLERISRVTLERSQFKALPNEDNVTQLSIRLLEKTLKKFQRQCAESIEG